MSISFTFMHIKSGSSVIQPLICKRGYMLQDKYWAVGLLLVACAVVVQSICTPDLYTCCLFAVWEQKTYQAAVADCTICSLLHDCPTTFSPSPIECPGNAMCCWQPNTFSTYHVALTKRSLCPANCTVNCPVCVQATIQHGSLLLEGLAAQKTSGFCVRALLPTQAA